MEEKRPNVMNVRPAPLVYHAKQLKKYVDRQNPLQYRPHEDNGNPDAFDQAGKDGFYADPFKVLGSDPRPSRTGDGGIETPGELDDARH